MSLSRVKPPGWGPNEELTHDQITDVDRNIENAVDKTAAGDTVAGVLEFTGAVPSAVFDAGNGWDLKASAEGHVRANGAIHFEDQGLVKIDAGGTAIVQAASGTATLATAVPVTTQLRGQLRCETTGSTTVDPASDGAALPTGTITVLSTTGFPSAGTAYVVSTAGAQAVAYTSKDGTHFFGCTGGTGTIHTGGIVSSSQGFVDEPWSFNQSVFLNTSIPITLTTPLTQTRWQSTTPHSTNSSFDWTPVFSASTFEWKNTGTPGLGLVWPLELPHRQLLTAVTARIAGSATDVALPLNKPVLYVYASLIASPVTGSVLLGQTTDAPANLAAYQAVHDLSVSGLAHTIDRTGYFYYAVLQAEQGTNANPGMTAFGMSTTVTRTCIIE